MLTQAIGFVLLVLGFAHGSPATVLGSATANVSTGSATVPARQFDFTAIYGKERGMQPIFDARLSTRMATLATIRTQANARYSSARQGFSNRVTQIPDAVKRSAVTAIDANIQGMNTTRTDTMMKFLMTMSDVLDKVSVREGSLKAARIPTDTIDSYVSVARAAIAAADSAVMAQAGKQYISTITSDSSVGSAVRSQVQAATTDLGTAYASVQSAKADVLAALRALATALKPFTVSPVPGGSTSGGLNLSTGFRISSGSSGSGTSQ